MKKIKYIIILLLLIPIGLGGLIVNNYYQYEQKQEDVRAFKKLAFQAFSLKANGANKKAIAVYEKAFKIYDREHKSLADAADLYRKTGDIKKAKELYEKAFSANSDKYVYLQNQALCEYLLKEYDESIRNINYLIHKDRNKSKYYKFLALNHFAKGEKEKAFGYYAVLANTLKYQKDKLLEKVRDEYSALEIKPTPSKILFKYKQTDDIKKLEPLIAEYKKQGFDIKALRTAQKILFKDPNHNLANKAVAELYFNHSELYEAYNYALKITEHDAKSLKILGAAYQHRQQFDKALEAFEKSYTKKPDKNVLKAMVVCAMRAKKIEDMDNYITRLTKIDPLLATQLIYAMETNSGVEHNFWDKVVYLSQVELYKAYCNFRGCNDA